jgi:hypothetical protein
VTAALTTALSTPLKTLLFSDESSGRRLASDEVRWRIKMLTFSMIGVLAILAFVSVAGSLSGYGGKRLR